MYFVSASLKSDPDMPLTESLVATIHRLTTEGIDYANNVPGEYRAHPVRAGTYVPPQERDAIRRLMRDFIVWVNSLTIRSWHPAVTAIAAHFYFISIHPFGDGNGRTARAIESFLLYRARINALGFYSLSNFYYRLRDQYIEELDRARFRSRGTLTEFICFALRGLVSELEDVHEEVLGEMTLIAFRDFVRERLSARAKLGTQAGERMYRLVTALTEPTLVSEIRFGRHPLAAVYREVSNKTLSRDIAFLRSEGLIVEDGGRIRANLELMQDFMP
jgi:Fic family protein